MSKYCSDCFWGHYIGADEKPCDDCFYCEERPHYKSIHEAIPPKQPIDQVKDRLFKSLDDIQKIIDDAMEKGDRSVHISIVGDNVGISVQPYKEEDEWGEWMEVKSDHDNLPLTFTVGYRCSKCGHHHSHMALYCGICGSRMKAPEPEGEKDAK